MPIADWAKPALPYQGCHEMTFSRFFDFSVSLKHSMRIQEQLIHPFSFSNHEPFCSPIPYCNASCLTFLPFSQMFDNFNFFFLLSTALFRLDSDILITRVILSHLNLQIFNNTAKLKFAQNTDRMTGHGRQYCRLHIWLVRGRVSRCCSRHNVVSIGYYVHSSKQ
jgi:hypothetical protein